MTFSPPGQGRDTIILVDASGAYYRAAGNDDLATIERLSPQDAIVLSNKEIYSFDRKGNNFMLYVMQGSARESIAKIDNPPGTIFKGIEGETFQIATGQTLGVFVGADTTSVV